MTVDVEKLTRVYTRIRDKRAEISAKFKEEDSALVEQQNTASPSWRHCRIEETRASSFCRSSWHVGWALLFIEQMDDCTPFKP